MIIGDDGANDGDVSSTNPLPVSPPNLSASTDSISVVGTRKNDGTDLESGGKHTTIGGSDGTHLFPILTDDAGKIQVGGSVTATVSGVATASKQDTGNNSLSSIDGKVPALGQALAASSVPIVLTATQISTLTPPAAITNFAKETGGNLADIKAKTDNIPALGQALATASVPVVLTAAQLSTLTPPAAITGSVTATLANSAKVDCNGSAVAATLAAETTKVIGTVNDKVADGDLITLGAKADNKSTATDTTAVSGISILKEISYMEQNPASRAVTNAGTFAVQATAVGTVADDATTPGAPVMVGGRAVETDGTDPSSVSAEDDVAIGRTDRNRRLLVNTAHPNQHTVVANYTSAQTDTEVIATPGANLSLYITDIVVSNGATAGTILFEEDTASAKTQKSVKLYPAINGGMTSNFQTPIRCTANKNFGITSATVTTHSIEVHYYIAP